MTATNLNTAPCADPAIWCGIPVYNNAATIVDVATRCRQQIAHVVVIDDGSTDADLTQLLKPLDVSVVRHPKNLGKGAALLTAFCHAAKRGGQYLITLDGDGQHFPEDIPRFLPHLTLDTILVGYRDEVTGTMPKSSRFGREFSDFWIYLETGRHVRDTQSGFRAYPLAAIDKLRLDSLHYNLEMEVITKAMWAGMRAETVLIRVWYPEAEHRVSSFHPVRDNLRISLLHVRLVFRQLLPFPHKRVVESGQEAVRGADPTKGDLSPMELAFTAGLSMFLGTVLWPWGALVIAYLTIRLHLSRIVAIGCVVLTLPPVLASFCGRVGRGLIRSALHPQWERFVGAHVVGFPLAMAAAWLVYLTASRFRVRRAAQ